MLRRWLLGFAGLLLAGGSLLQAQDEVFVDYLVFGDGVKNVKGGGTDIAVDNS